jgi:CRISP-associated protein Cas1
VQLCAQGLLLEEELGRPVPRGVLFSVGTRERVEVPFDEALRAKTLAAVEQCRTLSAQATPPEPLPPELRHRCHGCSLATVCLPEETLYQINRPAAAAEAAPPAGITRVIPQSDDGAVL